MRGLSRCFATAPVDAPRPRSLLRREHPVEREMFPGAPHGLQETLVHSGVHPVYEVVSSDDEGGSDDEVEQSRSHPDVGALLHQGVTAGDEAEHVTFLEALHERVELLLESGGLDDVQSTMRSDDHRIILEWWTIHRILQGSGEVLPKLYYNIKRIVSNHYFDDFIILKYFSWIK